MTLKELQKQIESTMGKELPTAAWLRAGNCPLAVCREITASGKLSVYVNGFALYETDCGSTVFRVDYCGGYTYFGANTEESLSEEFFADTWEKAEAKREELLCDDEYEDEEPSSKGKILKIIYVVVVLGFIGWFCYAGLSEIKSSGQWSRTSVQPFMEYAKPCHGKWSNSFTWFSGKYRYIGFIGIL